MPISRGARRRFDVVASVAGIGLAACAPPSTLGQDWPQWRGPGRNSVAVAAELPTTWPQGELKPVWRIKLGPGYSAPVVAQGGLFTHARDGEDELILCLDAATGQEKWRHRYAAPYRMHVAAIPHGPGPKATTTVADGRVYAFGISSILTCLDAGSGKVVWQLDLKKEYEAEPAEYGTAASPLVDGSLVVVPVGGKRGGSVMAFDRQTGKLVWKAVPGERPAMSSPIAADLAGVRHVLTFTEKQFVGLDARDGTVLWSFPFETPYRQNIVTPVVAGDLVIAAGTERFGFALQVTRSGDKVTATEAWRNRDLRMYMTSPVAVGGYVYGHAARNAMVCVDIKSGKTAWTGGNFGDYSSTVVVGDRLLVMDADGTLTVLNADPGKFQEVGRSTLSHAVVWSHLAIVGNRIFVRDLNGMACIELAGS